MKTMAVVYQHLKKDNDEIFYIGIGDNDRPYKTCGRNKHWHNVVNKHGYKIEILIEDISWELAVDYEVALIAFYGRFDKGLGPLVNKTDGGKGTIGFIKLIGKKLSEETKRKISQANRGKKASNETKIKLSEARRGKKFPHTEETKDKIRLSKLAKKYSEEAKKNMSKAKSGENHNRAKAINQYDLQGNFIRSWPYIKKAQEELGINHIDQVCLGNRKTAGKYIWQYSN
jgi:hypothetical protein